MRVRCQNEHCFSVASAFGNTPGAKYGFKDDWKPNLSRTRILLEILPSCSLSHFSFPFEDLSIVTVKALDMHVVQPN